MAAPTAQKKSGSLLFAAIMGAGIPWLGLVAAVLGWRWTSQTAVGPAWNDVWLYTNMMFGAMIFIVWPVLAVRSIGTKTAVKKSDICTCWLVMLLAAIPVLVTAGWLNQISVGAAINMLVAQLALAIFSLGLVAWIPRFSDVGHVCITGKSVGLFLLPPGIWLIQCSNFPWLTDGLWSKWIAIFPVSLIHQACNRQWHAGGSFYWIAGIYAIIGLIAFYQAAIGLKKSASN